MELNSILSIWHKPKEIIRNLHQSALSHHQLMLMLALVYFIQIGAFILSLEKITFAPLFSLNGLKLIIWFFIQVGMRSFVITYVFTLALWATAKSFTGLGTLPQTRGAVIWTLISTIPIGFFLLMVNFAFRHPGLGSFSPLIRIVSYAGILATLIYGFIILLKTMTQAHGFGTGRAFFSTILGLILFLAIIFAGHPYFFG